MVARLSLARRTPAECRPALILSTYPGKDWNIGHAVGLDALASARAILDDLRDAGHDGRATALCDTTRSMISTGGFAEYFDPRDASPAGGRDFTWTAATWLAWATPTAKGFPWQA